METRGIKHIRAGLVRSDQRTGLKPSTTLRLGEVLRIYIPGIAPTEVAPPFPAGLKVLGSIGSKRNPAFPNLPTLEEAGVRNASWDQWFGFLAPPNLPKGVRAAPRITVRSNATPLSGRPTTIVYIEL